MADCKTVLIVEDDVAISTMMKVVLELNNFKVFTAYNGEEGIRLLRDLSPSPCVIILDLMMPHTNGWQFLDVQRNEAEFTGIPVVVCSAYAESAKSVQPNAFVSKPVQYKALLGAVQSFCNYA